MPRVALTLTEVTRSGVAPVAEDNGDATNGHTVANDGRLMISARNSGVGARWIEFAFPNQVDGVDVDPRRVSIPAGETRDFVGFPTGTYGNSLLINVEHAEVKIRARHLQTSA